MLYFLCEVEDWCGNQLEGRHIQSSTRFLVIRAFIYARLTSLRRYYEDYNK
jgi:hypothetical protein